MRIIKSISQMQKISAGLKRKGLTAGFVPTMGALHQGHLSLIRACRQENKVAVVSIFVNPIQFGPREDLKKYPRPIAKDIALCKKEKVDLVFLPEARQMYPEDFRTAVEVKGLGDGLCGASRPGHFRGVATVVCKLFNIVQPDNAYFGQKDAQQAVIIRRMAEELNFPLKIKVMPTVREQDGLAMSSRNVYLTPRERKDSLVLSRSLALARRLISQGEDRSSRIIAGMKKLIGSAKNARIDYVAVVDPQSLEKVDRIRGKCLVALAVRFGKTRLIDNLKTGDSSHLLKNRDGSHFLLRRKFARKNENRP